MNNDEIKTLYEKHKMAVWIGGGIGLLFVLMPFNEGPDNPGQGTVPVAQGPGVGGQQPLYPGPGAGAGAGGGGGDFDMDRWRAEQERDDRLHEKVIEAIRETQKCVDSDTGEVVELPADYPCY